MTVASAVAVAVSCSSSAPGAGVRNDALDELATVALTVRSGTSDHSGCLLLADDDDSRRRGLQAVTDLGRYDGMAFTWTEPTSGSFWMYLTVKALTVVFVSPGGKVISTADMVPCPASNSEDCPTFATTEPYSTAIEVPLGSHVGLGLVPGSQVELGAAC